jgi:hypothetical protein
MDYFRIKTYTLLSLIINYKEYIFDFYVIKLTWKTLNNRQK